LDEAETFALLTSVGLRSNSARAQLKRALKGKPVPTAQIGAMRNAREHELAREGRLGDDPALRGRKQGKGKRRIDALATSFGFDDVPKSGGGKRRSHGVPGMPIPGNINGQNRRSKKRGKTPNAGAMSANLGQRGPRGSGQRGSRLRTTTGPQIDYAGLPRDDD
jgi:hypothetical protein